MILNIYMPQIAKDGSLSFPDLVDLDGNQIATPAELKRLLYITDSDLMRDLANRWCKIHGYTLGGYEGKGKYYCFQPLTKALQEK